MPCVPHLRKRESLHARALTRLAWALEVIPGEEHRVRQYYHLAHEHEPANPYFLANMLGFETFCSHGADLPATMRTTLREAIKACRNHAIAGIELPYAYFTGGRLSLLLGEADLALGCYARGIGYCLAGKQCIPPDALGAEIDWLRRLHFGRKSPAEHQRAIDLLGISLKIGGKKGAVKAQSPLSAPVLIVAGGAASMDAATVKTIRPLLQAALADFSGTVVSGGTTAGVPGGVGDVAGRLMRTRQKRFRLIGYLPAKLPHGVSADKHCDESIAIGDQFSPDQILRNWSDILAAGIEPRDVLLLGLGGGPLSAVEYRVALGLGASVGIVAGTSGAADDLLNDPLWSGLPNLSPLPFDPTTTRAFVIPSKRDFKDDVREAMAQSFHSQYVAGSSSRLPPNMRPWPELDATFKKANIEQAKCSVEILEAAGFGVRQVKRKPVVFRGFAEMEVEKMAELEHGRWNVESLRDGWRYGTPRDDSRKIHDCIVSWSELPEAIKHYDRDAVRNYPEILAKAGLEVYRP